MSQSVALCATQITRIKALERAIAFIEGATFHIRQDKFGISGYVDLSKNPIIQKARIPHYGTSLRLNSTPGIVPEVVDGVIQNDALKITIDGDYANIIESVVGVNGVRLIDYYDREVVYDTVHQRYGDNFEYVRYEEVIDGVTVPQLEAREKEIISAMC